MLARCLSASLQGLKAHPVTVEVDLAQGLPGIQLVGLPDKAIQESRERVRSALRNSGFRGPLVRVVINLAPADLRKEGPAFDLPIALGLLVASGQLDRPRLHGIWCAGELGLDGSLRPCRGVIAIAELAARHEEQALVVPPGNADEAALIPDLVVRTAPDLKQLVQQLKGERPCLRGDHTSHETWLQPQTIAAARQRMHDRNPGGVCNRELPATALGDRGGFAPAALQLWERLVAHRGYSTRSGIRLCYGSHGPWRT